MYIAYVEHSIKTLNKNPKNIFILKWAWISQFYPLKLKPNMVLEKERNLDKQSNKRQNKGMTF